MKLTPPNLTPGPWNLEAGRNIETPSGTFFLTYGREEGTSAPLFRGPTELDAIARAVAALPDLLAALERVHANAAESPEWIRRHTRAALIKAGYSF